MDIKQTKEGLKHCASSNKDNITINKCWRCPYSPQCEEGEFDFIKADALEAIEQLEERIAIMSEGGWRDAEKDPPKETDCYIVRIDYGVGKMTTMREYVSSEGKWLKSIEEKITHWMPMPKPPAQEETGNEDN